MRPLQLTLCFAVLLSGCSALRCYGYRSEKGGEPTKEDCKKGEACLTMQNLHDSSCVSKCSKPDETEKGKECLENDEAGKGWCYCTTDLCNGDLKIIDKGGKKTGLLGNVRGCVQQISQMVKGGKKKKKGDSSDSDEDDSDESDAATELSMQRNILMILTAFIACFMN